MYKQLLNFHGTLYPSKWKCDEHQTPNTLPHPECYQGSCSSSSLLHESAPQPTCHTHTSLSPHLTRNPVGCYSFLTIQSMLKHYSKHQGLNTITKVETLKYPHTLWPLRPFRPSNSLITSTLMPHHFRPAPESPSPLFDFRDRAVQQPWLYWNLPCRPDWP